MRWGMKATDFAILRRSGFRKNLQTKQTRVSKRRSRLLRHSCQVTLVRMGSFVKWVGTQKRLIGKKPNV